MSCENDCDKPVEFPRALFNRPALPRIAYRIGEYGSMRAHMLSLIDQAPALKAWTHRGSDDPGIALVEGAAVVGDILSLYQDDYANKAYLRTATLPASVTGLVRLLGYRPAPGVGGTARFALAVKGTSAITVPAGLQFSAQLEGAAKPATFENAAAITAVPALSAFHLYRPRRVPSITNGMDTFQLGAADGVELKAGDKLMVGLLHGESANAAYDHTQVLVVDKVWDAFGIRYVKTKGQIECLSSRGVFTLFSPAVALASTTATLAPAVAFSSTTALSATTAFSSTAAISATAAFSSTAAISATSSSVSSLLLAGLAVPSISSAPKFVAWKLGGDFSHFGHTAPPTRVQVSPDGRATEVAVGYDRVLDARQSDNADPDLQPLQLPLDGQIKDVAAGITVLVEANLSAGTGSARKRLLSRRVRQIDPQSMSWGSQSGAATVLTLDADLAIVEGSTTLNHADIRGIAVHAVQGAAFELLAEPVATSAGSGNAVDFYGSATDAQALLARTLLLVEPDGPVAVHVQRVRRQSSGEPRFEITLDRVLDYRLYPHDEPVVDVYGNLVDATEGKSEPETALGDGDSRAVFQTFPLPKAPLTYLLDATQSPPQLPELEIRVDGLLWQRVESFFDSLGGDPVFIVREADDGKSYVQFGDGVHGARLPSGKGNVLATYRTGSGSHGPLKEGASVSAKPRFTGFDKAFLNEPVTGGAAPQAASSVRLAAPGTMQSLGRIVSLADCETEAQSLPGVLKARAAWTLVDGSSVLTLTVLTDGLASADQQALDGALRSAFAARGPARFALRLRLGNRRFADVALRIGYDARRRTADLLPAVQKALGTSNDDIALDDEPTGGLFDWRERQFGQDVHGSQVVGRVQNVEGVAWVELQRLAFASVRLVLGTAVSPIALPAVQRRLRCPGDSLLALQSTHLAIEWVAVGAPK